MSQDSSSYNHGRYDLRQQTFCMSMLTCLSFNLTGSVDSITKKFRTSVENVLSNDAARELIGTWKLVWGPVVYADSFVGAKASVNSMFIAAPEAHPEQLVVAIAGTNGNSLMGWMLEDFNVKDKVAWPYGDTSLQPHISKGVAYGLEKMQALAEKDVDSGVAVTAQDFLAANPAVSRIMVTGHSLGGALAGVYSLYLENIRAEWDRSGVTAISCLTTAGQTFGDEDFSKFYGEKLSSVTDRVWNSLDIVPHAFQQDMLLKIPTLYESEIPTQKPIEKLIASLHRETGINQYLHVLPEAEGFPSTFMRLEDIAGEKYKPFVDFIENVTKLVKRANPFGANNIVGSVEYVVLALVQHIFPYFTHFGIDEFIKVMCSPPERQSEAEAELGKRSFWQRLRIFWKRLKSFFSRKRPG